MKSNHRDVYVLADMVMYNERGLAPKPYAPPNRKGMKAAIQRLIRKGLMNGTPFTGYQPTQAAYELVDRMSELLNGFEKG